MGAIINLQAFFAILEREKRTTAETGGIGWGGGDSLTYESQKEEETQPTRGAGGGNSSGTFGVRPDSSSRFVNHPSPYQDCCGMFPLQPGEVHQESTVIIFSQVPRRSTHL
jgi:hypothetical protein